MRSLIIKINLVSFRTFRHPLLPSFLVGSSLQQDSSRKNYYFQKSGGLGLNGTLKAQMNMVTVWEGGLRAPEMMSPLGENYCHFMAIAQHEESLKHALKIINLNIATVCPMKTWLV